MISRAAQFLPALGRAKADRLFVVYTMGKVASTSYSKALAAARLRVADIHTLDRGKLLNAVRDAVARNEFPAPHYCRSMHFYKQIGPDKGCLFVTGVRDPVERNLSAFFQNLGRFAPNAGPASQDEAKRMFKIFLENYRQENSLSWFDRELKVYGGIDVYELGFDKQARAALHCRPGIAILRLDAEPAEKNRVLSGLAGTRITVGRENVGAEKTSGSLYAATLAQAAFTADQLDDIYSSRYCEHFWTAEERKSMKDRWLAAAPIAENAFQINENSERTRK